MVKTSKRSLHDFVQVLVRRYCGDPGGTWWNMAEHGGTLQDAKYYQNLRPGVDDES